MKTKPSKTRAAPKPMTAVQRGQAAAKAMAMALRAEYKRRNLPQLSWKDGKVVATNPELSNSVNFCGALTAFPALKAIKTSPPR